MITENRSRPKDSSDILEELKQQILSQLLQVPIRCFLKIKAEELIIKLLVLLQNLKGLMQLMFQVTEEFTSEKNRHTHYIKHVLHKKEFGDITEEEYEYLADELMKKPVNRKNILGYESLTREGKTAYCKYDKDTGIFVVYTYKGSTPYTITCYTKTWREYNGDKNIEYNDEIPSGK